MDSRDVAVVLSDGRTVAYDPPRDGSDPRVCASCRRAWTRVYGDPSDQSFPLLNARTGKYHSGGEWGVTDCGKDATREHWMWPL